MGETFLIDSYELGKLNVYRMENGIRVWLLNRSIVVRDRKTGNYRGRGHLGNFDACGWLGVVTYEAGGDHAHLYEVAERETNARSMRDTPLISFTDRGSLMSRRPTEWDLVEKISLDLDPRILSAVCLCICLLTPTVLYHSLLEEALFQ